MLTPGQTLGLPPGPPASGGHVSFLSTAVQDVLDRGQFCAVATMTPRGPHCTPLVYVGSAARVWLTTSRRQVKADARRRGPAPAGVVRDGGLGGAVPRNGRAHAAP